MNCPKCNTELSCGLQSEITALKKQVFEFEQIMMSTDFITQAKLQVENTELKKLCEQLVTENNNQKQTIDNQRADLKAQQKAVVDLKNYQDNADKKHLSERVKHLQNEVMQYQKALRNADCKYNYDARVKDLQAENAKLKKLCEQQAAQLLSLSGEMQGRTAE